MKYYIKDNTGQYKNIDTSLLDTEDQLKIKKEAPIHLQKETSSRFVEEVQEKIEKFLTDFTTVIEGKVEHLENTTIITDGTGEQ